MQVGRAFMALNVVWCDVESTSSNG